MEKSNLIFNSKNLLLIKDIAARKLLENGIDINLISDFFIQVINDISREVYQAEYNNLMMLESKYFVLKMNNIIIMEIFNYIINSVQKEPMSTVIESESDEESDEESEKAPVEQIKKDQRLSYNYDLYSISKNDLTNNTFNLSLDKVIEIKLDSFTIDNSDYIINEFNNCLEVNNQPIEVPIGNYKPLELLSILEHAINETSSGVVIKFNRISEFYSFEVIDQPEATLNFATTNSICSILGFEYLQLSLTPNKIFTGIKHRLVRASHINIDICFSEDEKEILHLKYKILLDVPYNETKYFTPLFNNSNNSNAFRINSLNVEITNQDGKPYNSRSRNFIIDLAIKSINQDKSILHDNLF